VSAATKISLATQSRGETRESPSARYDVHRTFLPFARDAASSRAASDQRLHRDLPFVAAEKKKKVGETAKSAI